MSWCKVPSIPFWSCPYLSASSQWRIPFAYSSNSSFHRGFCHRPSFFLIPLGWLAMPFNTRISFGTISQSLPFYSFQSLILTRTTLLFSLLILLSLNLSININNFVLNALILHNISIRPFRSGALSLLFDLSRS